MAGPTLDYRLLFTFPSSGYGMERRQPEPQRLCVLQLDGCKARSMGVRPLSTAGIERTEACRCAMRVLWERASERHDRIWAELADQFNRGANGRSPSGSTGERATHCLRAEGGGPKDR